MIKYLMIAAFIIIAAAYTIGGFKQGFLKTLVSMSAIIIAVICVILFSGKVTEFLDEHTSLREKTGLKIEASLEKIFTEESAVTEEEQKEAIRDSWIPDSILSLIEETKQKAAGTYAGNLAVRFTDLIMSGIGILITLIMVFVVVKLLVAISGIIKKVPLLGGLNRILGAVLGFIRGLIVLWIICFVITILADTGFGQQALAAISDSKLLGLFYDGALSFGSILG